MKQEIVDRQSLAYARFKFAPALGIIALLAALPIALAIIEVFLPFRPTSRTTTDSLVAMFHSFEGDSTLNPEGTKYNAFQIHTIYAFGSTDQLVLLTYEMVNGYPSTSSFSCIELRLMTQRLISGVATKNLATKCKDSVQSQAASLEIVGMALGNYYFLGGVISSKEIASTQVVWENGDETLITPIQNSFLVSKQYSQGISYAVGLDTLDRPLNGSFTNEAPTNISQTKYSQKRQILFSKGLIVLRAYSQTTPYLIDCLELLYLTGENVHKFLAGDEAFVGQQACLNTSATAKSLGPNVSTVIEGDTVVGGRVLEEDIVRVVIHWSDGYQQILPVEEGFYFAQREGSSATIKSFTGFDGEGNRIFP